MNTVGIAVVVVVAVTLLIGQFEPALLGERDMPFATISKNIYGGGTKAENIIRAEQDSMFVELHMGEFSTGGYGIEAKSVKEFPDRIIVKVERAYPGNCVVTQAFTQPFHIIKMPKTGKPIFYEYRDKASIC